MAATFGKRAVQAYAPRVTTPAYATPAAPTVQAAAKPKGATTTLRLPLVTVAILVLLSIVFALELRFAPGLRGSAPSVGALIAYGAVDGEMVLRHGEWWRLLTAPLLHGNLSHIIGNGVVLAIIGFMLEPLIGSRWFAALYAAGALGGSLCSIALNAGDIPCVGASGAIMGVLAGAFFCGASHKAGPKGRKMQTWALRLILPSLIPMAADSNVDYAGHLGGVVAGLAMGVALQMAWTKGEDEPALGDLAAGFGLAVQAAGVLSLLLFASFGHAAAVAVASTPPGMIPDAMLPSGEKVDSERAADLVARYPHDPRAHMFRGIAFIANSNDLADAEEQFRRALDPADLAAARLQPDFAKTATVLLAMTLAYEGRPEEARTLGAPLCGFAQAELPDEFDTMQNKGICPGR